MRTYAGQNAQGVVSAATAVQVASSAPRKHQTLAFFMLTIQNTALVLVTKFSYSQSAKPYVASIVIASAELVKLVLTYILLVASDGQSAARDALREVPSNARPKQLDYSLQQSYETWWGRPPAWHSLKSSPE